MVKPNSQKPDVLKFLCRHLVALCITFQPTDRESTDLSPIFRAYAGTLIFFRHTVCLLTAGHILREIEETLSSGKAHILSAVLADTFGLRPASDHAIPFDYAGAAKFYIDDDEEGLDFGLLELRSYYVPLLAANGMVAMGEENWIHQSTVSFDMHLMLGLPAEFTSERLSESGEGIVSPTMFKVLHLDSPPEGINVATHPRFVGQIGAGLPLSSMAGMSGGPIFGFNFGPPMRYWIVAIQSSWLPDRQIIFGCPIPLLMSLIYSWLADLNLDDTEAATSPYPPAPSG